MADGEFRNAGEAAAAYLTEYGKSARGSGSRQLFSCLDIAIHQNPRVTIDKAELTRIAQNCRDDVDAGKFTQFSYGVAYSPEFVKEVKEALALRIEEVEDEKGAVERMKRELAEKEKSLLASQEKLEKLKKASKEAGLGEVM